MIKKTLRALRQLNATKEMMQKAEADKPTASNKWWKWCTYHKERRGAYIINTENRNNTAGRK